MWERMRQIWRRRKSVATVGIDFGAVNLKVAELAQKPEEPVLLRQFAMEDAPWLESASSQEASELLRDALGRNGIHAAFAVAGIGAEHSCFRVFRLPVMPQKELLEAVRWELQPFLAEDAKQYYYDAAVLANKSSADGSVVFAAAALRDRVDWLAATVSEAGMKLAAVEPEAVAFARVNGAPEEALLVKIEAGHAHLCFVQQGVPVVGETIARAKTESSMADLAAALTEGAAAYQNLHAEYRPQSICVGGDIIEGEMLGRVVAKKTGLPVRQDACWQQVTAAPLFDKEFLEKAAPALSLSIGLAMRGVQIGLH